jgi:hypothetical protein
MATNHEMSSKPVFIKFYRDAVKILIHPKVFYKAMPEEKDQQAIITFLILSALLYSIAASFFAFEEQFVALLKYFLQGTLMPFILAALLYLMMLIMQKDIGFKLALGIAAYANTALLFAWIPGMAFFAWLFQCYLIGVGIANVTGLSAWKSFFVLLGMVAMLLLLIYVVQMMIAH